jgi:hypothetical protein
VLRDVNCDACRTNLMSRVLLYTSVFIYFKQYNDTEQSLAYPEKFLETIGTAVTLMQSMKTEVAHLNSHENLFFLVV